MCKVLQVIYSSQVWVKALLNYNGSSHIIFFPSDYMGRTECFVGQIFLPCLRPSFLLSFFFQKDEVYLNLVLDFVPETVYRVARHFNKAKATIPIIYVKVRRTHAYTGLFLCSHPGSTGIKRFILVPQQGHDFVIIRFLSLIETCCLCLSRAPYLGKIYWVGNNCIGYSWMLPYVVVVVVVFCNVCLSRLPSRKCLFATLLLRSVAWLGVYHWKTGFVIPERGFTNTCERQYAASKALSHPTLQNHADALEVQDVNRASETKCETCHWPENDSWLVLPTTCGTAWRAVLQILSWIIKFTVTTKRWEDQAEFEQSYDVGNWNMGWLMGDLTENHCGTCSFRLYRYIFLHTCLPTTDAKYWLSHQSWVDWPFRSINC